MRTSQNPKELEARRFKAIKLLQRGVRQVDIAKRLGVSQRSVRKWKSQFQKEGSQALKARPMPGRPPRLDSRDKKELEQLLLKGAQAAGFETDLWTCARVAQLIWNHFGVRYHPDYVGPILHRLGWSPQKPQRKALEQDEDQVQTWMKKEWPQIKKKPLK